MAITLSINGWDAVHRHYVSCIKDFLIPLPLEVGADISTKSSLSFQ